MRADDPSPAAGRASAGAEDAAEAGAGAVREDVRRDVREDVRKDVREDVRRDVREVVRDVVREVAMVRDALLARERACRDEIERVHPSHRASAANLIHYLALRGHDLRGLQARLSMLGLSSLGRCEAHVRATVDAVLRAACSLAGTAALMEQGESSGGAGPRGDVAPVLTHEAGDALLERNTRALLGDGVGGREGGGRRTRIMGTMPPEAAEDPTLVEGLMARGMTVVRINGAHDDEAAWGRMLANVRRAEAALGRSGTRVLMDLPGPKLRTGALPSRRGLLRLKPRRDEVGRIARACRVVLVEVPTEDAGGDARAVVSRVRAVMAAQALGVDLRGFDDALGATPDEDAAVVLAVRRAGSAAEGSDDARVAWSRRLRLRDARGLVRRLDVEREFVGFGALQGVRGVWARCARSAYVTNGCVIERAAMGTARGWDAAARVVEVPDELGYLLLRPGDVLLLTRAQDVGGVEDAPEAGAQEGAGSGTGGGTGGGGRCARIACTMPRALDALRVGHRVMLDDGKIACVCARVDARGAWVRVVECLGGAAGQKLRADKGVNLPDADITMDALPEDDARVLSFAAGGEGGVARVQMVGLSFVQRREDVERVRAAIAARAGDGDGARVGLVLKVETRAAFERLPELLLAAMAAPVAGVMIARGDLAVEVGYERLAEVQEELLWLCEAAHVPVIWATQVLERLAKSGAPTRAEITDAAMGQRAECVMLNKGPYLPRAVEVLGDILHRMEGHQEKKSAMMRPLGVATRYWSERGVRGAGSGP